MGFIDYKHKRGELYMPQVLSLEEIEKFIIERLPRVLESDPQFATWLEGLLAEKFPRRDEFARLLDEVQQHRAETAQQFTQVDQRFDRLEQGVQQHRAETTQQFAQVDQRFEQVDQRFEQVNQRFDKLEQKVDDSSRQMQISIDRLGQRWGIRNESIFRQTMREILEKSFDTQVQERHIGGEQFDCVIIGDTHILIEISASVGQDILRKLQRKRQLYTDDTGVVPARFLLVVGSIHSRRATTLREAGFEVIEPEEEAV